MSKNSSPFQHDMRLRRTKKLIWEALLSLLEKQTFATLSMKAICEQAMVHRATFYSHFTDKYALLDYGMQEAVQAIKKEVQWNEASDMQATLHYALLEYVRTHQRLFSLLLSKNSTESFSALLLHRLVVKREEELAHAGKGMKQMAIPRTILAQFYGGAVVQVITWWVEQEMPIPSEELAGYLQRLLPPLSEE